MDRQTGMHRFPQCSTGHRLLSGCCSKKKRWTSMFLKGIRKRRKKVVVKGESLLLNANEVLATERSFRREYLSIENRRWVICWKGLNSVNIEKNSIASNWGHGDFWLPIRKFQRVSVLPQWSLQWSDHFTWSSFWGLPAVWMWVCPNVSCLSWMLG